MMGCELRRQLSEPGAGDCCESMPSAQEEKGDDAGRNGELSRKTREGVTMNQKKVARISSDADGSRYQGRRISVQLSS